MELTKNCQTVYEGLSKCSGYSSAKSRKRCHLGCPHSTHTHTSHFTRQASVCQRLLLCGVQQGLCCAEPSPAQVAYFSVLKLRQPGSCKVNRRGCCRNSGVPQAEMECSRKVYQMMRLGRYARQATEYGDEAGPKAMKCRKTLRHGVLRLYSFCHAVRVHRDCSDCGQASGFTLGYELHKYLGKLAEAMVCAISSPKFPTYCA